MMMSFHDLFFRRTGGKRVSALSCVTVSAFCMMIACCGCADRTSSSDVPAAGSYSVTGHCLRGAKNPADSVTVYVMADRHDTLTDAHLLLDPSGSFSFTSGATDVSELYIETSDGHVARMYAVPGGRYEVVLDSTGRAVFSPSDTLNGWLQAVSDTLALHSIARRRAMVDSLCGRHPASVRTALLLRDQMQALGDTLFVRRCLGRLLPGARPDWLMADIDRFMDTNFEILKRNHTLKNFTFTDMEGKSFTLTSLNRNAQLLAFWADYDTLSVQALEKLAAWGRDYGVGDENLARLRKQPAGKPRQLGMVTFCLHAADSAAWRAAVKEVPGLHVWLQEGFNHPAVRSWAVRRLPVSLLLGPASTLKYKGRMDDDLRVRLDSLPVRPAPGASPAGTGRSPGSRSRSGNNRK